MPDLVADARALIARARQAGRCLDLARAAERRIQDAEDARKTGRLPAGGGVGLMAVGVVVCFAAGWTGVGLFVGVGIVCVGAASVFSGADDNISARRRAERELERAIEDLRECLGG